MPEDKRYKVTTFIMDGNKRKYITVKSNLPWQAAKKLVQEGRKADRNLQIVPIRSK